MTKKFVSNKDETVRMFENNFLESLSKVHPSIPVIIYLPVILYMGYLSIWYHHLSFLNILALLILGVLVWTITEYTLHRFIFHYKPKNKLGERIHFIFHGVHHDYPSDSKRLVMPPTVSIPIALLFYFIFNLVLGNVFIYPFFAGFITGYLFYDLTHYAIHHFSMRTKFWLAIKNHHMRHHYQDPKKGFGVSTPIWDSLIGTDFPNQKEN